MINDKELKFLQHVARSFVNVVGEEYASSDDAKTAAYEVTLNELVNTYINIVKDDNRTND